MKKVTLFAALLSVGLAAGAQSLNVSSAYEAWNRGYLKKAMGYIDDACKNEQTKEDGQTWFYSTMIYCSIGDEIAKNSKKGRELAAAAPRWYSTAFTSLINWHQYDTKGEYTSKVKPFFRYVGNHYYNMAVVEVDGKNGKPDYTKAMHLCDSALILGNMMKDTGIVNNANYLAGQCARATQDNEALKKYFLPLTRIKNLDKKGIDAKQVYTTMFNIYVAENDTVNAMKTARNYSRNVPGDYQADALLASAYLMTGNTEKSIETMNKAVEKVANDPAKKAEVLCLAAAMYEQNRDYTSAEAKYKEAIAIAPSAYAPNFGLASMNFNNAVDKIKEAEQVPFTDATGAYDRLLAESKESFKASIPYFVAAIAFIDAQPADQQPMWRGQLYNCLNTLNTVYARLEMYDEAKAVQARVTAMQSAAQGQ